jgi:hypothetical protein
MISNHAWGTAIDLRLNSLPDRRGDNRVQQGLVQIAPFRVLVRRLILPRGGVFRARRRNAARREARR